jgi:hypothetical protein
MSRLTLLLLRFTLPRPRDERGDVPGWVMVVVMTAGICAVLYALAKDQLSQMLDSALAEVR